MFLLIGTYGAPYPASLYPPFVPRLSRGDMYFGTLDSRLPQLLCFCWGKTDNDRYSPSQFVPQLPPSLSLLFILASGRNIHHYNHQCTRDTSLTDPDGFPEHFLCVARV